MQMTKIKFQIKINTKSPTNSTKTLTYESKKPNKTFKHLRSKSANEGICGFEPEEYAKLQKRLRTGSHGLRELKRTNNPQPLGAGAPAAS